MSSVGGKFRQRCRMNLVLINCCIIDWYDEWDDDVMFNVVQVFFFNVEFIISEGLDIEVSRDDLNVFRLKFSFVEFNIYVYLFIYIRYCLLVNKVLVFVSYFLQYICIV